jgi:hypothetical protein
MEHTDSFVIARALKGYVTRRLFPGHVLTVTGDAYELSFAVPRGLSGAPLVAFGPNAGLMGVCIGSHQAETSDWEEEIDTDGVKRRKVRVVEYGVASVLEGGDIIPFVDKPLVS